ncbi:hypothetical protein [Glycomyces buryatensis]|uniref:Uncharacterized protein n=1 Tax=Glycomyces buryatensis TaxID=2570927 RepID=A0A4S8PVV0_9ACTN|nr:hypothetical protein [Glycomyces buryatensis]THV35700.1 hypothetical protein FAB82_22760 [Glycomyces buryatensis]
MSAQPISFDMSQVGGSHLVSVWATPVRPVGRIWGFSVTGTDRTGREYWLGSVVIGRRRVRPAWVRAVESLLAPSARAALVNSIANAFHQLMEEKVWS